MAEHAWRVEPSRAGARLDQCVLAQLQMRYSRAQIQRWLVRGFVRVNGAVVPAHRRVKAGDDIVVDVAAATASEPVRTLAAEDIPLDVVFEDVDVLVVNKPAGLVTHPAPGHWSGTLVNAVLGHLQSGPGGQHLPAPAGAEWRPGIVHRLDKETSGLLAIAKTDRAHASLAQQLKRHTMRRMYLACATGLMELDEGTVDVPVGRHLTDRKRMTVRHLGGREAITHYRVLQRVRTSPVGPYSVVECRLETGRTHQVRVHLAHLGHPVLGDATYGKTGAGPFGRHLLHAVQLEFAHPVTGERLTLRAPVPPEMAAWVPTA